MAPVKTRIRKNDLVQVIAGASGGRRSAGEDGDEKARGKRGKVLEVNRLKGRAIVEGVNLKWKHRKRSQDPAQANQGRIQLEASIPLSNLMVVCPKCDSASRLRVRVDEKQDAQGRTRRARVRVCKKCGADIPERV